MSLPSPSKDSLHHLYTDHHRWLFGWLRQKVKEKERAADLMQDTFLSILTTNHAQEIREPRPFLVTIARRLVANYHRRQVIEEAYLEALAALSETHAPSPEDRAMALELLQHIDQALSGLPVRVKQAFLLAHLEGLSYAEIASVLQVSTSSVKQYLSRANQQCFFYMP